MKPASYAKIACIILIALTFTYLPHFISIDPIDDAEWGQTRITLTGIMEGNDFPVIRSGIAPMNRVTQNFIVSSVLTIKNDEGEPVFFKGGRHEMLGVGSAGNSVIRGVTFDEINDAYKLGLEVQVTGIHYRMKREGETYPILKVEEIKVLEPERLPLIIYGSTRSVNLDMDMVELDDRLHDLDKFTVGRIRTGSFWKQVSREYQIYLRENEVIEINYTSSRPITMEVSAPTGYGTRSNTTRHGDLVFRQEKRMEYSQTFQCHRRGIYTFVFSGGSNSVSDVELELTKKVVETDEVFFIERGGTSCMFGGMGLVGFAPSLPPLSVNVGRSTDTRGHWCEYHREYKAYFEEEQEIRYQFNGTEPIKFTLVGPNMFNHSFKGFYLDQNLTVPYSGTYDFKFRSDFNADMSFRAHHLDEIRTIGNVSDPLVIIMGGFDSRPPSWIPQVSTQHCLSTLRLTEFPVKVDRFYSGVPFEHGQVLTLSDVDDRILHFTGRYECALYPDGGDSMVDMTSLFDLVNCYENNFTIDVWGFPFSFERNGTSYNMFHVSCLSVVNRNELPLTIYHSVNLVSGRLHHCSVEDGFKTLPVAFKTGLSMYNSSDGPFSGYSEHYFNVYLVDGETIRYSVNATEEIQFILYQGFGIRGFTGRPEKYIYSEKGVNQIHEILEVNKTGAYYFGVRGYSGKSSDVQIDIQIVD